jgi:hypothetical protein
MLKLLQVRSETELCCAENVIWSMFGRSHSAGPCRLTSDEHPNFQRRRGTHACRTRSRSTSRRPKES